MLNTSFRPPNLPANSGSVGSAQQAAPSSPPRMGFVAGAPGQGGMNGYVGGKPAKREEPGNPQTYRTTTNLASPDPALAQSSFTQSEFTQTLTAATQPPVQNAQDKRLENLRRFKEGNGIGANACGLPSRSALQQPRNGPAQMMQSPVVQTVAPVQVDTTPATQEPSYIAYALSDPGNMYKTFSGTTSWFRMAQLIVPEGKVAQRIYISTMLVSDEESSYSLRLVDPSVTPSKTLWAEYNADNTDNFIVYTATLTNTPKSALIELQGQHTTGAPLLVSSVILEFQ